MYESGSSDTENWKGMGVEMKHGYVKVAAVTPKIRVADTVYNEKVICDSIKEAAEQGAKVIVLPELCVTGYTCGDLFCRKHYCGEQERHL